MSLDTQLGKIIEDLKLSTPDNLAPDEPLVDRNWNNVVNSIKTLTEAISLIRSLPPAVPPIGMAYIRFPGEPEPHIRYASTRKEQWKPIHELYPDCFFRLKGNEKDKKNVASLFKKDSEQVTYDTGTGGDGGGQIDTLQAHSHSYSYAGGSSDYSGGNNWALDSATQYTGTTTGASGRTSPETRPKNITIELYVFIES